MCGQYFINRPPPVCAPVCAQVQCIIQWLWNVRRRSFRLPVPMIKSSVYCSHVCTRRKWLYDKKKCICIMSFFYACVVDSNSRNTHTTNMRLRANTPERMPFQKNQLAQAFKRVHLPLCLSCPSVFLPPISLPSFHQPSLPPSLAITLCILMSLSLMSHILSIHIHVAVSVSLLSRIARSVLFVLCMCACLSVSLTVYLTVSVSVSVNNSVCVCVCTLVCLSAWVHTRRRLCVLTC